MQFLNFHSFPLNRRSIRPSVQLRAIAEPNDHPGARAQWAKTADRQAD
jgi:hypothetical protein